MAGSPDRCKTSVGTRIDGRTCRTSESKAICSKTRAAPGLTAKRSKRPHDCTCCSSWAMLGAKSFAVMPVPHSRSIRAKRRSIWVGVIPQGYSGSESPRANVPYSTSAAVLSGYVAAKRIHIGPPSEIPNSVACSDPAASITARTSSIRCSSVGRVATGSESPVPRLSSRIKRQKDVSRRRNLANDGSSQAFSTCETQPGTRTRSNGPSPTT